MPGDVAWRLFRRLGLFVCQESTGVSSKSIIKDSEEESEFTEGERTGVGVGGREATAKRFATSGSRRRSGRDVLRKLSVSSSGVRGASGEAGERVENLFESMAGTAEGQSSGG